MNTVSQKPLIPTMPDFTQAISGNALAKICSLCEELKQTDAASEAQVDVNKYINGKLKECKRQRELLEEAPMEKNK